MVTLNELSLFSGYGGFSLGLRLAGINIRTVAYVEWDKYPQQVIQARQKDGLLSDAPIFSDISAFRGEQFRGLVDIVTGGFPCQPHSVSGARRSSEDSRNKWPDTLRVIREVEPRFVLLENVAGLLSSRVDERTPAYGGVVVGQLTEIGYDCFWTVLGADNVGASHRRKRWLCFAVMVDSSSGRYGEPPEEVRTGGNSSEYADRNVVNSTSGRFQEYISEGQPEGHFSPTGQQDEGELADSKFEGLEGRVGNHSGEERETSTHIEHHGNTIRSQIGCSSRESELADPKCDGEGGAEWTTGIEQYSQELGDSESVGSRRVRNEGETNGSRGSNVSSGVSGGLPVWPPRPNERDKWERVIRERPDLSPTLSRQDESRFRGMDDGSTHRVGELKMLGNGIVPPVVAKFLREGIINKSNYYYEERH